MSISPDGKEIWDWAHKMSHEIHRQAKISELSSRIAKIGTGCGDCCYWMCNNCPREYHVKGRRRGPSMNAPICNKYAEKELSTKFREDLKTELEALLPQHSERG